MKLGAFSVSLNVKDIKTSQQFYENLGFEIFGGDISRGYLILKNKDALIGLFQGMFEGNIITFNPGWDQSAQPVQEFDDVRTIQKTLQDEGVVIDQEIDENTNGPGSIMLKDPDGNVILIDQHI